MVACSLQIYFLHQHPDPQLVRYDLRDGAGHTHQSVLNLCNGIPVVPQEAARPPGSHADGAVHDAVQRRYDSDLLYREIHGADQYAVVLNVPYGHQRL
ncbi:hypothetical protein D3C73_1439590 [compost metagenome]